MRGAGWWLAAGLLGCGGGASGPASPPAPALGRFTFFERVAGGIATVIVEGAIEIRPDTILVEAAPGPCQYEESRSSALAVTYQCGPTSISINRVDPLRRSAYATIIRVMETQRTCVRLNPDRSCAEWRTQNSEREVPRSGWLRPRAIN